jgi:hypothetical protein
VSAPDPADVRRAAARAAAEVFERLVAPMADVDAPGGAGPDREPAGVAADVLARVAGVLGAALDALAARDGDGPVVAAVAPGGHGTAAVWLHGTGRALPGVALRATRLTSADGAELDGVTLHPPVLDVPAGGSACATLAVRPPEGTAPGSYHGHVLAAGYGPAAVPVRVDVG